MSRLFLIIAFSVTLAPWADASAQTKAMSAEARVHFKRGNVLYDQATRSEGARRKRLLERSLQAYSASLRIVRSRNALFNTAVVFEELGRIDDAFNYYTEHLAITGLSEQEQHEARSRRSALESRVALVEITSVPSGATCWVDRMDTGPVGTAPLLLAVSEGTHQVLLRKEGYEPATADVNAVAGKRARHSIALTPRAAQLVVEAEEPLTITLDGEPIVAGTRTTVPAGEHELRFGVGENTFSRMVSVPAGERPFVVKLVVPRGLLIVHTLPEAQVYVDGAVVGQGPRLEVPVMAGAHRIQATASSYRAAHVEIEIEPRGRHEITLSLDKSKEHRLKRAALGTLAGAGATLAVATALSIRGRAVNRNYARATEVFRQDPTQANLRRAQSLRDKTDRLNLTADLLWATTAAAGVTALTLYLVKRRRERRAERVDIAFAPTVRGAFFSATVSLGGSQ